MTCTAHGKIDDNGSGPAANAPAHVVGTSAGRSPEPGLLARVGSALLDRPSALALRVGPTLLRFALALVFVWFGAMKVTSTSPVFGLVAATLPWFNPHIIVPLLGVLEVALGIGLMIERARRLVLAGLAMHLTGTFLSFITAPSWMFQHGNMLLLTADGEFVLKNLVLVSGALVLLGMGARNSRPIAGVDASQVVPAAAEAALLRRHESEHVA
jgi:uncharacterized membrane protein YkgB